MDPLQIGIESNAYKKALPQKLKETSLLSIRNFIIQKISNSISSGFVYFEKGKVFLLYKQDFPISLKPQMKYGI
ncbi:MAG: hypothetical protein Q8N08_06595 [Methanobacteriaceae archaeon]|nr:hypothetical protein [Methanobacteriaceae archaeon]